MKQKNRTNYRLIVKVQPNASKDEIVGLEADGCLKVKIAAPPIEGLANKKLILCLSKYLGINKRSFSILSGEKSRQKVIEIVGDDEINLNRLLEPYITKKTNL